MSAPLSENARAARLRAVRGHATRNGIDFVEVLDRVLVGTAAEGLRQRVLLAHAVKPFDRDVRAEHVRVEGGVRISPVEVDWAFPAALFEATATPAEQSAVAAALPDPAVRAAVAARATASDDPAATLVVGTAEAGDYSPYTLRLEEPPGDPFDPLLATAPVDFKIECPTPFDCAPEEPGVVERLPAPRIDYLAKDYASFRRLMLDRLALTMPDWTERSAADVGVAIVEVLAYAADELSYYQDAVATEAYLGTARRRVSVRRHARLLGYRMHDGVNARAWVHVTVGADLTLPAGTTLLTRVAGAPARLAPDSRALTDALAQAPLVFETLHEADLVAVQNEMTFYTWGEEDAVLPRGAVEATLTGHFPALSAGDVLVLVEARSPVTARRADADPERRHAVRLTRVEPAEDPLGGRFQVPPTDAPAPVTRIAWDAADALPFGLCLAELAVPADDRDGGPPEQPASLAYGNVILADHGQTITAEALEPVPAEGRFRPVLDRTNVTFAVPYDHGAARERPAAEALASNPGDAVAAVRLYEHPGEDATRWTPRGDLLASDRFAREFVVETEHDGTATLRFGDDTLGRAPAEGLVFTPVYRTGGGGEGNVGAGALGHVVSADSGVTAATNLLPARGGVAPEPVERVRQRAPHAFRTQQRAVTPADYAAVTRTHPEVQKAVARMRWTGAWATVFITVDRTGGRPVDAAFEATLRRHLDPFRMAGHDVEIEPPRFVPLEIAMTVCVAPGYLPETVLARLLEVFSTRDLPDGARGFFHPDRFTFGQPLYLSGMVAAAMAVPGVRWVDLDPTPPKRNRFRRRGRPDEGAFDRGRVEAGRLEILRLDNDPNAPENGTLTFFMEGGS